MAAWFLHAIPPGQHRKQTVLSRRLILQLPDVRIKALSADLCVFVRMHEQDAREMAVLVAALLLIGSAFLGTGRGNV